MTIRIRPTGWIRSLFPIPDRIMLAKEKEKRYLRRKFVDAYFELHRSERALTAAQKAQKDATDGFLAWQTICKQAGVRTDAPGAFEVSEPIAS